MAEHDEASAARTERWEARLGSLETRLQMLETSLKAEVDRIQLAAEGVDGLVGDLRGTIGETRNVTELVNDIGDRLTLLHSLEGTVTDAARNVADSVYAAITERLAQLEQGMRDDRPDLGPIESSVAGLRADLEQLSVGIGEAIREVRPDHTQLHGHLDAIRADLDQRTGALADQLVQLRAGQVDLAPLATAVDQLAGAVTARLDELGGQVHTALAALREQPDVAAPLQRIVAEVADVRVTVPQLSGRIDELRRAIDAVVAASPPGQIDELRRVVLELAAAPPDLTPVVTPIATRIDQLATAVDELAASSGAAIIEPLSARLDSIDGRTAALGGAVSSLQSVMAQSTATAERLAGAIEALRASPDASEQVLAPVIDRLALVLDSVSGIHHDLEQVAGAVGALRAEAKEPRATGDGEWGPRLSEQVAALGASLAEVRGSRPDVTSSLQALASVLEAVQRESTATASRLDDVANGLQRIVDRPPPPALSTSAGQPLAVALDELGDQLHSLDGRIVALASAVQALAAAPVAPVAVPDIAPVEERLGAFEQRLEELGRTVGERVAAAAQRAEAASASLASAASTAADATADRAAAAVARAAQEAAQQAAAEVATRMTTELAQRLDVARTSQPRRDDLDGASAALVASAAAAMARLEGRIDSEFDAVNRNVESLAQLLQETVEALHRIESHVGEIQPVSERMRDLANRTLDAFRTRRTGGPRQLGR